MVVMEQFGPYTLLERIGSGGMCEVFRARRDGAEHDVALKRLHREMEEDQEPVDLFLTEADIGMLINHKNLVNTVEADEVDGRYFIAMELIDGLDLGKALRLGAEYGHIIDTPLAIHITIEMLHGLDYLHNICSPSGRHFGLVHRDVSPENVFLTSTGQVKVADFGIAKLGELETVTTVLGGIKGKLTFMSPEQIRGEHLDGRADLFCAGLILYEMITGHRPYAKRDGESEVELAIRVREADIPVASKLESDMDSLLDEFLRKALHKRYKKRYTTCEDFAFELENYVIARGISRKPSDVADLVSRLLQGR